LINSHAVTEMENIMKKFLVYSSLFLTLILLNGCAPKKIITYEAPVDFQFVTTQSGDTYNSLAEKFTGLAKLAWRIEEFNNHKALTAGQEVIIPLRPFRPGGLSAEGYQLVPVLSYHHFSEKFSRKKLIVSAARFREQLEYFKRNNFHVITMDQFIGFLDLGQVPEKSVLITIDDGWISSYDVAYPILKEYGANATLFIPTQFVESKSRRSISWAQIKEMVSDKAIDIQCHTKSHRDLSEIEYSESFADYIHAVEQEVLSSKQMIYSKLGKQATALAYPFGNTNPLVVALIKKHGYKAGFTVNRKSNPFYQSSYLLNRSMVFGTYNINRFIRNLDYFEKTQVSKSEPIDTLESLATIAENNPEDYENKRQWRTASLAWKLRRDKLMSQMQTLGTKSNSELRAASKLVQDAKQKVLYLSFKLADFSKQHYLAALEQGDSDEAKRLLLESLLYNPNNQDVIELFQTDMGKIKPLSYQVKANDSFASIAKKLYRDRKKAILIPLFNDKIKNEQDLKPGMTLSLPATATATIEIKASTTKKACNITLSAAPEKMANDYYSKAIESFNRDQIPEAIKSLTTAVCLNPKHSKAKEMLEMLSDL